jgi:hypothetical protein
MNLRHVIPLATAALLGSSILVLAQDNLLGRWRDNAPGGDPIGSLEILKDSIAVGRKVTYQVKPAGAFGDGQLFEVTGLNRKQDPEGCGPNGKVRYLAVQPLPPIAPGLGGSAIRVFFYSGGSPPTIESVRNDTALCSIHPFSR